MTQGKNKGIQKKGTKVKKADRHAFTKKEWFKLLTAPTFRTSQAVGWVPGNTTIGKKQAADNVINRVVEVSYADIAEKSNQHWRKVKMQVEKVEGNTLYTSFAGLGITRERIMSQLKKRQTLIEMFSDVKTQEGYILRVGTILLTTNVRNQRRVNSYAKSSQIRRIRKLVSRILSEHAAKGSVDHFATEILSDSIPKTIQTDANHIFPIRAVQITKVKVLKKSKIDVGKLVEDSLKKGDVKVETVEKSALEKEQEELEAQAKAAAAAK